jgi:methylthioribose-1-phosphate isomerase
LRLRLPWTDNVSEITIAPVAWREDRVRLLDQTKLPHAEVYLELEDYHDVALAIAEMKVRGAPAIGVAGAYGIALGALQIKAETKREFLTKLEDVFTTIGNTRPTARNLFHAIERMREAAEKAGDIAELRGALVDEAKAIHRDEAEASRKLSGHGAELLKNGDIVLTHCNTGPLATAGYGTALGVIIRAHQQGKKIKVLATETRPLLQGARLTAWELKKMSIPFTLITDTMAGYFMSQGKVSCVIVGADRIAANGDVANKIGTYTLAVLAKEHGVPFYVAAPTSTFDLSIPSGDRIPIERRSPDEVTRVQGVPIAPAGTDAENPAFDVTPHRLISAIITEKGVRREF